MEEIDIIELLQRVKEGKAPKEIEINNHKYTYDDKEFDDIVWMYHRYIGTSKRFWIEDEMIRLNTTIKILDKPIIEEFEVTDTVPLPHQFRDKINEIIDYVNQNNKE